MHNVSVVSNSLRPHGLYSHGILQVRILGLPTATRLLVHGIVQARILEWVTVSFSRGSSQPRDGTQVSRTAAAAAAKSLQSCPTLCNPIDGSPPGSPCPWDSPGKNTGMGCHSRTAAGLFSSGATRDAAGFLSSGSWREATPLPGFLAIRPAPALLLLQPRCDVTSSPPQEVES